MLLSWNIISIFFLMLNRFLTESVSIGIETDFVHWNNTYPSITFCMRKNRTIKEIEDFLLQQNISSTTHAETATIKDYMFLTPTDAHLKYRYCEGKNSTCGVDIQLLRKKLIPSSCEQFVDEIIILDQVYVNCTDILKFQEMEMGYCFLTNNIFNYGSLENLPLKYDTFLAKRHFKVTLKPDTFFRYQVYVHSPEEYPHANSKGLTLQSSYSHHIYKVNEIINSVDVIHENIQQRKCKFPFEMSPDALYHYSFSTCMTALRTNLELKLCNCTMFVSPKKYSEYYCDIEGLQCLTDANIQEIVKKSFGKNFICYPSCEEQQITEVGSIDIKKQPKYGHIVLEIQLINIPAIRYNRMVTQTPLDLVVSVGGAIGLFVGASLVNVMEIIYVCVKEKKIMFSQI